MHSLEVERNIVIAKTPEFSLRACHRKVRMNWLSGGSCCWGHSSLCCWEHTWTSNTALWICCIKLFFLTVEHSLRFPSLWGSVLTHSLTLSIHMQGSKAWTTDGVLSVKQERCMKTLQLFLHLLPHHTCRTCHLTYCNTSVPFLHS